MRIVFMGSPEFSVQALRALQEAGHEIAAVYSQPPRPKGRGHEVEKTAVHQAAEEMGLLVRTPASLKSDEEVAVFRALKPDVAVVVAYGLILRKNILEAPTHGCINIHASLLPRWRGAAPIQRAIEAGDAKTGVTIMQMDIGLDTGPMLLREEVEISETNTSQDIHNILSAMGARLIVTILDKLEKALLHPEEQPEEGVTYAHKLAKEESIIDWSQPADVILRKLRAFTPWPGLWTSYKGERIRVHQAAIANGDGQPGAVIVEPMTVACGEGAISLQLLQRAGKNKQGIDDFCRGFPIALGEILG